MCEMRPVGKVGSTGTNAPPGPVAEAGQKARRAVQIAAPAVRLAVRAARTGRVPARRIASWVTMAR